MKPKPKMFVTRRLPRLAMDRLAEYFDVEVNPDDRVLDKSEVIEKVRGKDALLSLLTDTIDAEVMDANPGLKVISNYAVGYNNVDVEEATKRGIPVCITPGVLTETTADCTWALLMAVSRRIVEGDRFIREDQFVGWGPLLLLGGDVYGKTLGIIGLGRIGQAVAKRASGFDMQVVYYSEERVPPEVEQELGVRYVDLETLLKESDFVSMHVPLSPDTFHLIGERELTMMKSTAYLINTARGPVIDEKALVQALRNGEIGGAGLDVYEEEPMLATGLADLDNVVLQPHTGSATIETRTKMGMLAAENAIAVFEGRMPHAIVNPDVIQVKG